MRLFELSAKCGSGSMSVGKGETVARALLIGVVFEGGSGENLVGRGWSRVGKMTAPATVLVVAKPWFLTFRHFFSSLRPSAPLRPPRFPFSSHGMPERLPIGYRRAHGLKLRTKSIHWLTPSGHSTFPLAEDVIASIRAVEEAANSEEERMRPTDRTRPLAAASYEPLRRCSRDAE